MVEWYVCASSYSFVCKDNSSKLIPPHDFLLFSMFHEIKPQNQRRVLQSFYNCLMLECKNCSKDYFYLWPNFQIEPQFYS